MFLYYINVNLISGYLSYIKFKNKISCVISNYDIYLKRVDIPYIDKELKQLSFCLSYVLIS